MQRSGLLAPISSLQKSRELVYWLFCFVLFSDDKCITSRQAAFILSTATKVITVGRVGAARVRTVAIA